MRVVHEKTLKNGKRHVLVELSRGESIVPAIDRDAHYSLGEPLMGDIYAGHILADAYKVFWCSISQKWIES